MEFTKSRRDPGVDCLSCHAIRSVPEPTGNGRAHYAPPAEYPFDNEDYRKPAWMHGFLLRLRPAPHRAGLSIRKPDFKGDRSATCVSCHRLSVTPAQNHYKFLRYDDTWSEWQQSRFSGESLHTTLNEPARKDCVSCHPPHAKYLGYHDRDVKRLQDLKDSLRVEVFALRREAGSQGTERLDAPLSGRPVAVQAGRPVTIDVLIENTGIGHAFPSGAPDVRDVWLQVVVEDGAGRMLLASGAEMEGAHRYGLAALDRRGKQPPAGSKSEMVSLLFGRLVSADAGDVARYRFTPPAGEGPLKVTARLLYRATALRARATALRAIQTNGGSFPPVVLGEHSVTLRLENSGASAAASVPMNPRTDDLQAAPRLFAYGVALLAQSDNARARRALQQASRLVPANAEYLIGLGRAYIAEGDLLSARRSLEEALRKEPGSPRAQAWLGATFRQMGQFEAALQLLEPLAARYPRDRELWRDIGLCYMRTGKNEEAARAFTALLSVDPDDAGAHYNLMQSYLRQRKVSLARREETIFKALQEDEPLRPLQETYFQWHPKDRVETLPIHEHRLLPPSHDEAVAAMGHR
jgi:tetratricopeptide (TPR) repeat protein